MAIYRTEGIVLHTGKFQDFDQIVTLFTPGEGILRCLVKGALNPKFGRTALTAPLSRIEFIYTSGRGDLCTCREISMLNSHLQLREEATILEAALDMLQTVRATQLPQKGVPDLYKLLLIYLEKLALVPDPKVIALSFRLKTLRHEGLLNLDSTHFSLCSEEERSLFHTLATSRSLAQLKSLSVPLTLCQQIRRLFEELL